MDNLQHYIRHPEEFPIELSPLQTLLQPAHNNPTLKLLCNYEKAFAAGSVIDIRIPSIHPSIAVIGEVDECTDIHNGYELSITFSAKGELMRIRMLEQLCYIRRYRQYILKNEGRDISDQDAALEWINKYAALFPADPV